VALSEQLKRKNMKPKKNKILKFITTIFFTWLSVFIVTAQEYQYVPFPGSNAVWSELSWSSKSPAVYNKYALFDEDTVINYITYHKLFHTANNATITRENSVCIGGIREDSLKRIFVNSSMFWVTPEIKEIMLYDFSVNAGDTVRQHNDSIETIFSPPGFLVVKDIDTILIHNSRRKVFSFNHVPWTLWIEGIGNVQGLIFPSGDLTTGGDKSELICMHYNDILMYYNSGYDGCVPSFVINDVALLPNPDVKVYPNPVKGEVVNFENLDFETLELYNIEGNLVLQKKIKGLNSFVLKTSGFSPGVYSYQLKTKGLVPTQGKLIIR
jgi:hypothetical protein